MMVPISKIPILYKTIKIKIIYKKLETNQKTTSIKLCPEITPPNDNLKEWFTDTLLLMYNQQTKLLVMKTFKSINTK